MSEHEDDCEPTPELIEDLRHLSRGLPLEELTPLSDAELVELLLARTRLGSLVRDAMTLWLSDGGGRADELRAYMAEGLDARAALIVHQRLMSQRLAVGEKRDLGHGDYIGRLS